MERIILTASDETMLTNGEVYGKTVYLGINDKPENWYEISEEEYRERMAELEAESLKMI